MADTTPPPQALESERAIIAAAIVDGREAMKKIMHIVTKDDFYEKKHAVIWRAAAFLAQRDNDVDLVTISDFLNKKQSLEMAGGSAYLSELTNDYMSPRTLVAHAKLVADRAVARRIIAAAGTIIDKANNADDMEAFVNEAEKTLKGITRTSARKESKLAVVNAEDWRKIARESSATGSGFRGLSTGYRNLDEVTEGFEAGEVMIVTGHTKHGKSKLAANIVWNVAKKGHNVMFINTEMTKLQLGRRLNGMEPHSEDETPGTIYLNDRADLVAQDAISIMEHAKELGCDMVVIDHLHFFSRSVENQVNELSKITKEFKEAAVQFDLPLMLLCHIQQGDTKKVPTLQMLKGSSSIAQDADMVLTVWRDDRPTSPDPFTTKVVRLAHRSAERAMTMTELYGGEGIRLLSDKPPTTEQQRTFADDIKKIQGEKDDDEDDLESGW